jgi:hypothetical protein
MKVYFIALIVIVVAGFSFIGLAIFKGVPQESKKAVLLNTLEMTEANSNSADSTMSPAVIAVYLAGKSNAINNGAPWADAFVCVKSNRLDTSKTDTILLLDTRTGNENGNLGDVTKYWTGVKPALKLNECRISIPESLVKKFKNYQYKYCNVQLVTDD